MKASRTGRLGLLVAPRGGLAAGWPPCPGWAAAKPSCQTGARQASVNYLCVTMASPCTTQFEPPPQAQLGQWRGQPRWPRRARPPLSPGLCGGAHDDPVVKARRIRLGRCCWPLFAGRGHAHAAGGRRGPQQPARQQQRLRPDNPCGWLDPWPPRQPLLDPHRPQMVASGGGPPGLGAGMGGVGPLWVVIWAADAGAAAFWLRTWERRRLPPSLAARRAPGLAADQEASKALPARPPGACPGS